MQGPFRLKGVIRSWLLAGRSIGKWVLNVKVAWFGEVHLLAQARVGVDSRIYPPSRLSISCAVLVDE